MIMVLTKTELLAALQNEVRILLHLAEKIDPSTLDYRPTPKQRSTLELLRYLSIMGPTFVEYAITGSQDPEIWNRAAALAESRDFEQTIAAIAAQSDDYARLLGDVSDDVFRQERSGISGVSTKGASLVNVVLCGCAAYRTQLFLYLKACGRQDLGTMNLWAGMDAPAA
jgi:hypothetical protein